ncbi:hypothetical protein CQW23_26268 [Capsicum baccatum]|uniref:Uncharacterized protein ycf23 n=1 Tax=Capsicum baccatum TaxID=33114 RepID=A0A2G2VNA5_CAPBA|nr:hypothetical protein CQW23_26268 [Capsicum baccatum]
MKWRWWHWSPVAAVVQVMDGLPGCNSLVINFEKSAMREGSKGNGVWLLRYSLAGCMAACSGGWVLDWFMRDVGWLLLVFSSYRGEEREWERKKGVTWFPQQWWLADGGSLGHWETKRLLPSVTLSVTVLHTLSLPDQVKLDEQLELEGVDIIQMEGEKCSTPSKVGVLGLIKKAVNIPIMCSSGLSVVTTPMAIIAGAAGVGVGSSINKIND